MRTIGKIILGALSLGVAACASGDGEKTPADQDGSVVSADARPPGIDAAVPSDAALADAQSGDCEAVTDLFPVPVSDATSLFPSTDDDVLEVAFATGFTFSFYGTSYASVFLNTNGGMTFGAGDSQIDPVLTDALLPSIAPLWGDMAADLEPDRAGQMTYQACSDKFVINYGALQDFDEPADNNSGSVTLLADGTVEFAFASVLSNDILVGVFDGTHTNDALVAVAASYTNYPAMGTGVILFDSFGVGPSHVDELSAQTITFTAQ